jgi:hypothetical protein
MARIIKFNEIAYIDFILSIDVKASYGKIAFKIVKGCKRKDYIDGNAVKSWKKLKNKYEPVFASSIVKVEKPLRDSSLKKCQDHVVWITELEDFCVILFDMGSSISENQFMIYALNDLSAE